MGLPRLVSMIVLLFQVVDNKISIFVWFSICLMNVLAAISDIAPKPIIYLVHMISWYYGTIMSYYCDQLLLPANVEGTFLPPCSGSQRSSLAAVVTAVIKRN